MTKVEFVLDERIRSEIVETVHTAMGDALQAAFNPIKTREETAKLFGVSEGTVDNWVKEGLPKIKVKSLVHFDYHEVVAFLRRHKV